MWKIKPRQVGRDVTVLWGARYAWHRQALANEDFRIPGRPVTFRYARCNFSRMKMTFYKLSIMAVIVLLGSCGYKTYPRKFASGIAEQLPDISSQLLATYRQNANLTVMNEPNYRLQHINDDALNDRLRNLDIEQIDIIYKADSSTRPGEAGSLSNDIFAQVDRLDSCIQFTKRNSGASHSKWETTYGVIYCFGRNKPAIHNSSDEFHNMIRQINDSTILFRQNLPHAR